MEHQVDIKNMLGAAFSTGWRFTMCIRKSCGVNRGEGYVLEWMRHSSSAILDMYFTMNDRQAHAAMNSMSFEAEKRDSRTVSGQSGTHFKQALPQPTTL